MNRFNTISGLGCLFAGALFMTGCRRPLLKEPKVDPTCGRWEQMKSDDTLFHSALSEKNVISAERALTSMRHTTDEMEELCPSSGLTKKARSSYDENRQTLDSVKRSLLDGEKGKGGTPPDPTPQEPKPGEPKRGSDHPKKPKNPSTAGRCFVYFNTNSASLDGIVFLDGKQYPSPRRQLDACLDLLPKEKPLQVKGRASEDGSQAKNQALSEKRSSQICGLLFLQGESVESCDSLGEEDPLVGGPGLISLGINRSVELLSSDPE